MMMLHRRFVLVLVAVGVAATVAVHPGVAKEGVEATLTTRIPLGAPTGTRLEVHWRLGRLRQPFNANGVFIRLVSASGDAATEGFASGGAHPTGEYRATVVVPKGGIGDVEIGLMGWSHDANRSWRSDVLFSIANDPLLDVASVVSSAGDGPTPWVLVLGTGGLATFAILGIAFALRRRARRATSHRVVLR